MPVVILNGANQGARNQPSGSKQVLNNKLDAFLLS